MVQQKGMEGLMKKSTGITRNRAKGKASSVPATSRNASSKAESEEEESYDAFTLVRDVLVAIAIVLLLFLDFQIHGII